MFCIGTYAMLRTSHFATFIKKGGVMGGKRAEGRTFKTYKNHKLVSQLIAKIIKMKILSQFLKETHYISNISKPQKAKLQKRFSRESIWSELVLIEDHEVHRYLGH